MIHTHETHTERSVHRVVTVDDSGTAVMVVVVDVTGKVVVSVSVGAPETAMTVNVAQELVDAAGVIDVTTTDAPRSVDFSAVVQ